MNQEEVARAQKSAEKIAERLEKAATPSLVDTAKRTLVTCAVAFPPAVALVAVGAFVVRRVFRA